MAKEVPGYLFTVVLFVTAKIRRPLIPQTEAWKTHHGTFINVTLDKDFKMVMDTDMNNHHNLLSEKRRSRRGKEELAFFSESLLSLSLIECSLNYFSLNNTLLFGKYILP